MIDWAGRQDVMFLPRHAHNLSGACTVSYPMVGALFVVITWPELDHITL